MPIISKVKFSKITSRMDAEYFHPSYLEIERILKRLSENPNFKVVRFQDISTRIRKGIFSILKTEYKKEGIPFIRVSNIKNLMIDEENLTFISEERNEKEMKTCLNPKDIVVSKGGTIGEVAIIPPYMPEANISQDVIGISIKSRKVFPEYVCVYLASKFGNLWFKRNRSQQTHPHLGLQPVRELPVPIPSKEQQFKVSNMINDAVRLNNEANRTYATADELFLSSVGLDKTLINEQVQTINYSNMVECDRFDVEFFKFKYMHINEILKRKESEGHLYLRKLHEVARISKGIEVGSKAYQNEGDYIFLRVSNISEHGIEIEKSTKYIRKHLYDELAHKHQPRKGEILYSKDGTIGTSLVVESDFPTCIISAGIIRIKSKKNVDPYYLAFALNSLVCRSQAERHSIGTVIKHLPSKALKNLTIPFIPNDKQKKISTLVQKSLQKRKKSELLINRAILHVENLLEKRL